MARALLPEVVIRRYTCGMRPQAMSCLPIMVIPVGYMPWHGRPMVRALPRQAMMGQCRSGRLFDIALFFSYPFPLIKEVGFSQVETGGTKFRWLEFVLGRI